ncbi:hypothetical protein U9M73_17690 [Paenibacillus phoenicis]|jgi:hypothetical protein|uniref:Uncharacterized protein n=1 Tax=Paenibacillus phoenicis TaxID=554117 RepID=A0ABU5PPA0_9BACL|nr:hypothetical protein [Paenibacillus phoenicis]MEA3571781.1 hypothetical protein [Paenibacillus phoenicis]
MGDLTQVALVRGPYDTPFDYEITTGYLVDKPSGSDPVFVMYAEGAAIYFTLADKLRDSLYVVNTQSNCVDFYIDAGRDPSALIAEIAGKLRSMTALDFMRALVRTPGDHAIYYR